MIFIKKFLDKISAIEGRNTRDLIISLDDARGLRDDINKLIIENYDLLKQDKKTEPVIQVELSGGKW